MPSVAICANMGDNDKTIVYGIVAACVVGMVIIGALVLSSDTSEGFSELYFEDHTELPRMVDVNEEIDFAFTVVSHERDVTTYDYNVTYDNRLIKSGTFKLMPEDSSSEEVILAKGNEKTIDVSFVPKDSSLVRIDAPIVKESSLELDERLGMVTSQGAGFERVNVITTPKGYSVITWGANNSTRQIDVEMADKLIFPIELSVGSVQKNTGMLIFDPNLEESFSTNNSEIIRVGDPYNVVPNDLDSISSFGYKIKREGWEIENDRGNLFILHQSMDTDYRYEFRKMSVEVSSLESEIRGLNDTVTSERAVFGKAPVLSEYEIHFWIIVKEDPDKLAKL